MPRSPPRFGAYFPRAWSTSTRRIADLERQPSTRGTRGHGLDLDRLRADGAQNRERFESDMDWK